MKHVYDHDMTYSWAGVIPDFFCLFGFGLGLGCALFSYGVG